MEESGKNPFLPVSSECPEETYFFRKKPNPATGNMYTTDLYINYRSVMYPVLETQSIVYPQTG